MAKASRARVALFLLLVAAVLAAAAAGGWLLRGRLRAEREDREIAALKEKLDGGGGGAEDHYRLGLKLVAGSGQERAGAASDKGAEPGAGRTSATDPPPAAGRGPARASGAKGGAGLAESDEEGLAQLEIAAERAPESLLYGNAVRFWSVRFAQYDRSIRFCEGLVAKSGALPEPRLQLALAYVDKMPDHMMGIVGQGRLSKQSIAMLDAILASPAGIARDDTRWAALYALGLNHLYWPKALRHAPRAVETFRRLLDLQKAMRGDGTRAAGETPSPEVPAYFVLAHLGLGDALVKDGRYGEAREVWTAGRQAFPREPRLEERLAMNDDAELTRFVDRVRGLGVVIDTDLAILWGRKP